MIKITKINYANCNENFKQVLESAYEDYYEQGKSNDLAAITLGKLEEKVEDFYVNEMIDLSCSLPGLLCEAGVNVTDPHIVQEKKGKGISVTVNGKEYRYVSPDRSTEDVFRSFMGMYSKAIAGYKALNWLKRNALQYYSGKSPSEEGREIVGFSEKIVSGNKSESSNATTVPRIHKVRS